MTEENKLVLKDIPKYVLEQIKIQLEPYATNIIALHINQDNPEMKMMGSGVFVQKGNMYGILTANHVIRSAKFRNATDIGLVIKKGVHRFMIPKDKIFINSFYNIDENRQMPDIAIIILPNPDLGYIKANKSFINLEKEKKIFENWSFANETGIWALIGAPEVLAKIDKATSEDEVMSSYINIVGFSGGVIESTMDNYDICEYKVSYDKESDSPSSFGGVSGGGLWHVMIKRTDGGKIELGPVLFSGIAFCQSEIENNERTIYCHCRKTIYELVYDSIINV